MTKIYLVFTCLFLANAFAANAQNAPNLTGAVVDSENKPVENVSVVMQTIDSVFVGVEFRRFSF
jgi:hypothetical protein